MIIMTLSNVTCDGSVIHSYFTTGSVPLACNDETTQNKAVSNNTTPFIIIFFALILHSLYF